VTNEKNVLDRKEQTVLGEMKTKSSQVSHNSCTHGLCRFNVYIEQLYSTVGPSWHYSTRSSTGVDPAAVKCDTSARPCRTWRGRWSSGSTSTETTPTPPRPRRSCWPSARKWPWSRSVHLLVFVPCWSGDEQREEAQFTVWSVRGKVTFYLCKKWILTYIRN